MVTVWMFVAVACSELVAASTRDKSTSRRKLFDFPSWDCHVPFCAQCDPIDGDRCATCNPGMSLNPTDGTCNDCSVSWCMKCDQKNYSTCLECSVGFSLQSNGTCKDKVATALGVIVGLSVGIPALCCLVCGLGFWFCVAKGSPKRQPMANAAPHSAMPPYTSTQPQGVPYANTQPQGVPYINNQPPSVAPYAPYTNAQPQGAQHINTQPPSVAPYAPYTNAQPQGAPYINNQPPSAAPCAPYTNTQLQPAVPYVSAKMCVLRSM